MQLDLHIVKVFGWLVFGFVLGFFFGFGFCLFWFGLVWVGFCFLCGHGCPETSFVDQASLKLTKNLLKKEIAH